MGKKLKELLQHIAVSNEQRFDAITGLLNNLGIKYTVQERSEKRQVPIYENSECGFIENSNYFLEEVNDECGLCNEEDGLDDDFFVDDEDFVEFIRQQYALSDVDIAYLSHCEVPYVAMLYDEYLDSKGMYEQGDNSQSYNTEDTESGCLSEVEGCFSEREDELEKSIMQPHAIYNTKGFMRPRTWQYKQPKIIGYNEYTDVCRNIVIPLSQYNKENGKKIVFMAHYDAVTGSDGANDNGSSVAILIAFALDVIEKGSNMPMEVVFTDREETGGVGSRLYIEKSGSEILEVINLDTCGVGSDIITCDWSKHPSEITWNLIYGEPLKKLRPVFTRRLPYCDSDIVRSSGYDVMTICTLPDEDVEGIIVGKPTYSEVYKYMHNGKNDSIKYVKYDVMEKILEYLRLLL